jgi:coenzyme F420-0:L-glutamate ligase/coenzyme F420-1:gamma-L-glutamate ligase
VKRELERVKSARVARLATADRAGRPHCVPVCFVLWKDQLLIPLDEKPKQVEVKRLRRVRNVLENPQVTLLVDHYDDDWDKLWFVMIEGIASLVELSAEPVGLLRAKYVPYRNMTLTLAISIQPTRQVRWPLATHNEAGSG